MRTGRAIDRSEDGQVVILFGSFLIVLLGANRHAQSTADAAALAGAVQLMSGSGDAATTSDALGYVEANDINLSAADGAKAAVVIDGDSTSDTGGTVEEGSLWGLSTASTTAGHIWSIRLMARCRIIPRCSRNTLIGTNPRFEGEGVMVYLAGKSSLEPGTVSIHLTAPETSPHSGGVDGMAL
jgi:hypothetical protein